MREEYRAENKIVVDGKNKQQENHSYTISFQSEYFGQMIYDLVSRHAGDSWVTL